MDPTPLQDEIRKLKDDVHALREQLAKMNESLVQAAWSQRASSNRRGRRHEEHKPNPGRRASDRLITDPRSTG